MSPVDRRADGFGFANSDAGNADRSPSGRSQTGQPPSMTCPEASSDRALVFPDRSGAAARIVITGAGIVSPLGRTPEQVWRTLRDHTLRSGGPTVEPSDWEARRRVADFTGEIDDFGELPPATHKALRKSLRQMTRETQLGLAAGQQALMQSQLLTEYDPDRVGICFGADNVSMMPADFETAVKHCVDDDGQLDLSRWGTEGLSEMAPLWLLRCLPNMPACYLAILNDFRGPNNTITQRDVAFGLAIAEGTRHIRSGEVDAVLVGATGTTLCPINLLHARLEREVADEDDRQHQASLPSEGAGAIVLESLQSARRRGVPILGEVLSSSFASFVGGDGAFSCGRALATAMRQSLTRACLHPTDIGHIHASGVGMEEVDRVERQAIEEVLGGAGAHIPVIDTKRFHGHAGAGAAAIELVASLHALSCGDVVPGGCGNPVPSDSPETGKPTHAEAGWVRVITPPARPPGSTFLSLSLFGRGLGCCVAVGSVQD